MEAVLDLLMKLYQYDVESMRVGELLHIDCLVSNQIKRTKVFECVHPFLLLLDTPRPIDAFDTSCHTRKEDCISDSVTHVQIESMEQHVVCILRTRGFPSRY